MTAADKYYLTARDNYPYDMPEAIEALEYGLSYDDCHAGLLTLKGEICYKDLRRFDEATTCFELALAYEPEYVDAHYEYIRFLLRMGYTEKAKARAEAAMQVHGIDKATLMYQLSLALEKEEKYHAAINQIRKARMLCQCSDDFPFYGEELERMLEKLKYVEEHAGKLKVTIK